MKTTLLDTRTCLAGLWSLIAGFILVFIVIRHGDDKALLNLVIGMVGGIITGILGTYFSMNLRGTQGGTPGAVPQVVPIAAGEEADHAPSIE